MRVVGRCFCDTAWKLEVRFCLQLFSTLLIHPQRTNSTWLRSSSSAMATRRRRTCSVIGQLLRLRANLPRQSRSLLERWLCTTGRISDGTVWTKEDVRFVRFDRRDFRNGQEYGQTDGFSCSEVEWSRNWCGTVCDVRNWITVVCISRQLHCIGSVLCFKSLLACNG